VSRNGDNPTVSVNGVSYGWPKRPVVVVCIDGGDPSYIESGLRSGIIPNIARFMKTGFSAIADGTVPSFTCPNNMSMITGTLPSTHGISGNFYLDAATGEAVVMTGPELLRGQTIFAEYVRVGARVVAITAKDKLRRQLAKGLDVSRGSMCFSSEKADKTTRAEHGIDNALALVGCPLPDMYSAELSLFVLDAGIRLLERDRPDVLFLSLTDYIQHKYAPGEATADAFYRAIDQRFGRLAELGAVVALTADHGMNDKSTPEGKPKVIWLQDILDDAFGKGDVKVICPITDAFVAHHGALGGFVRVWCRGGNATPERIIRRIENLPGIAEALDKATACRRFSLPADREGDVAVIGDAGTCIGGTEKDHDLSGLEGHRLRTHGATAEARVPFILSEPLSQSYAEKARAGALGSEKIFDFAINGIAVH
jgi:phosphonoacetate hydrolase